MTIISNSFSFSTGGTNGTSNKQDSQSMEITSFSAMLSEAESKLNGSGFAGDFLMSLSNSLNSTVTNLLLEDDASFTAFPFSESFVATFGTSGPLPKYINTMTIKLGLSAEQNLAFQEIAIKNKDVTYSAENVQKIAMELEQAGIVA